MTIRRGMFDMGLFDNAKFGDRYLTRNGNIAIYQKQFEFNGNGYSKDFVQIVTEDKVYLVDVYGKCGKDAIERSMIGLNEGWDIVSRFHDDLDNEDDYIESISLKVYTQFRRRMVSNVGG